MVVEIQASSQSGVSGASRSGARRISPQAGVERPGAKLSEGADVTDPLKEMFFGAYGALNDKFGVRWMFQANKQS